VSELVQNYRILDLAVTSQQQHLRDHFGRLGIVVGEEQEEPAAVLCGTGKGVKTGKGVRNESRRARSNTSVIIQIHLF
jgi:hypothetical protein